GFCVSGHTKIYRKPPFRTSVSRASRRLFLHETPKHHLCGLSAEERFNMALSVHTNYASLVTQNTLNKNNGLLSTAMERLGTGLRINSAADDAAGLQIATRLSA